MTTCQGTSFHRGATMRPVRAAADAASLAWHTCAILSGGLDFWSIPHCCMPVHVIPSGDPDPFEVS